MFYTWSLKSKSSQHVRRCALKHLHSQRRYRNFYCTVTNSRKEHTCSNATFSCKSQEKISVGDRRGKIWHCRFFWTTPSVLASEPEESQRAESLVSMASKSGTERAQRTRANAPTYSAPAGPSRASRWSGPAGPLVAAQSLSMGESVRGAGPKAKVRAYVATCVRACVGGGRGSRQPTARLPVTVRKKHPPPPPPSRHPASPSTPALARPQVPKSGPPVPPTHFPDSPLGTTSRPSELGERGGPRVYLCHSLSPEFCPFQYGASASSARSASAEKKKKRKKKTTLAPDSACLTAARSGHWLAEALT